MKKIVVHEDLLRQIYFAITLFCQNLIPSRYAREIIRIERKCDIFRSSPLLSRRWRTVFPRKAFHSFVAGMNLAQASRSFDAHLSRSATTLFTEKPARVHEIFPHSSCPFREISVIVE